MELQASKFTDQILIGIDGSLGRIHLNRPESLNSLNADMCLAMSRALLDWEQDPQVKAVAITGEGRGLCAGGDVVAVRANRLSKRPEHFFKIEYGLIKLIAAYSKPIVPIMHGFTMGGGLGISAHASHPVVTASTKTAMPEGRIGFWCDVGMVWPLVQRSPGQTGVAFALTGAIAGPEQTIDLGLANWLLPDDALIPELLARLAKGESPDEVLHDLAPAPATSDVESLRAWVDPCFEGSDPTLILQRLEASDEPDAKEAAEAITGHSPLSMHVILLALRLAEHATDLNQVLDADLMIATHFTQVATDFDEGVRAQLVDKDKSPTWLHESIADVPERDVEAFFTGTYNAFRDQRHYRFLNRAK